MLLFWLIFFCKKNDKKDYKFAVKLAIDEKKNLEENEKVLIKLKK